MIFDSIYIIFGYDIILLNMKYSIRYIISFRLVKIAIILKSINLYINTLKLIFEKLEINLSI